MSILSSQIALFFLKGITFTTLILVFTYFTRTHYLQYSYGNPLLEAKLDYLKNNNHYNTLAVGFSYFYRHFIPQRFDSIAGSRSFNLATPGMMYMECAYLLDNVLDDKDINLAGIKDILLLTQMNLNIPHQNLHTDRNYWVDSQRFLLGVKVFSSKLNELSNYVVSHFERSFLFQLRNLIMKQSLSKEPFPDFEKNESYVSLDDEPAQKFRNNYFKRKYAYPKRDGFDFSYDGSKSSEPYSHEEQCFLKDLNRLEEKASAKGIRLNFVFLPNDILHHKLKLNRTLYLGDGSELGARLFTERLAVLFNESSAMTG